ncbi:MAG: RidA family protein [Candidatus Latescibacterota bacterium]|nr:MAG: RidA family protein [Candidatus Latescibacterota bacterium]
MKKIIRTDKAPAAIGPYSQAVDTGEYVFVAGQVGIDPPEGKIVSDKVTDQTRQALENLKAILEAAGLGMDNVVKATVFLASMDDFQDMNSVYSEYFANDPPARAAFEVAALPLGARVEIEAIAKR